MTLADFGTVYYNKSGAKMWFAYFDLCTFSEYKKLLRGFEASGENVC